MAFLILKAITIRKLAVVIAILVLALCAFLAWRKSVQSVLAVPDKSLSPIRSAQGEDLAREFMAALTPFGNATDLNWNLWATEYRDSTTLSSPAREALAATETTASSVVHVALAGTFSMPIEWTREAPSVFPGIAFARRQVLAAAVERTSGKHNIAAARILDSFRVADQMRNGGPGMLGMLVGIAMDNILLAELSRNVPDWAAHLDEPSFAALESTLLRKSQPGEGIEQSFRNEYLWASVAVNQDRLDSETTVSDQGDIVTKPPSLSNQFAFHFLHDRQETLDKIGAMYSDIVTHSKSTLPSQTVIDQSPMSGFSYRHFHPLNVWGWFSASSSKLSGVLATYYQSVGRTRVVLLALRLAKGRSTLSSEQYVLINPTTGAQWQVDSGTRLLTGPLLTNDPTQSDSVAISF